MLPSKVELLPEAIRIELEQRLERQGFSGYQQLADWLKEQGYEISKSSVHRFGQKFEDKVQLLRLATRQAQEMKQVFADDEAAVSEASLQLNQSLLFQLQLEKGEELTPKELALISRAVVETSRGTVAVKRYQQEVKDKLIKLEREAPKRNLDPETLRIVREEIYGLAG